MKAKTILQAFQEAGKTTALFTVKGKVLGVYGDGATYGLSEQQPDPELQKALDMPNPPSIYDGESTEWIYNAAYACIKKYSPDLMYCTNNDFIEPKDRLNQCPAYLRRCRPPRLLPASSQR